MSCCVPCDYPVSSECPRGPRGQRGPQGDVGPSDIGLTGVQGPVGPTGPSGEDFGNFFVSGEPGTLYSTTALDGNTVAIDGSVVSEGFSAGLFTSTGTGSFTYVGTESPSFINIGFTMNLRIVNVNIDDTQVFNFTGVLLRNGTPTDAASTHYWSYEILENGLFTIVCDAIVPNNPGDVYSLGLETIYVDGALGGLINPADDMLEVISYSYSAHVVA